MSGTRKSGNPSRHLTHVRALVELGQRASGGVLDITEGVHQSVRRSLGLRAGLSEDRCGGLSGRVYAAIRAGHGLVGLGLDSAIRAAEALVPGAPPEAAPVDATAPAWQAILNGVCGDLLARTRSPWAIRPALHRAVLPRDAVRRVHRSHLVVMVHGLCMSDLQWAGSGDPGHGESLARALGAEVLYYRYNTGLAIACNARLLSEALETELARRRRRPARLTLVGHSMGGLVSRSAALHAERVNAHWREGLRDLVLIGSPNRGAPLERAGVLFQQGLSQLPFARHFTRLGDLRSTGIRDLADGRIVTDGNPELAPDLRCLLVAGQLSGDANLAAARWLGDGLVPVESALEVAAHPKARIDREWVQGTGHLALLASDRVRARLLHWLA